MADLKLDELHHSRTLPFNRCCFGKEDPMDHPYSRLYGSCSSNRSYTKRTAEDGESKITPRNSVAKSRGCFPRSHKSFWSRLTIRELGGFFTTNLFIAGTGFLFNYFVPHNLFPEGKWRSGVFIGTIVLCASDFLLLWSTYLLDPGVLPRGTDLDVFAHRMANLQAGERICFTCKIIRPKRAKHCRYCDHCVEVFDHHCPFVGVCIGDGNYSSFFTLLAFAVLTCAWMCAFSTYFVAVKWHRHHHHHNLNDYAIWVAVGISILSGLLILTIGHLCGYHVLIGWTGETTNERVLDKRRKSRLSGKDFLKRSSNGSKSFIPGSGKCCSTDQDSPSKEPLMGAYKSGPTSATPTTSTSKTYNNNHLKSTIRISDKSFEKPYSELKIRMKRDSDQRNRTRPSLSEVTSTNASETSRFTDL